MVAPATTSATTVTNGIPVQVGRQPVPAVAWFLLFLAGVIFIPFLVLAAYALQYNGRAPSPLQIRRVSALANKKQSIILLMWLYLVSFVQFGFTWVSDSLQSVLSVSADC
ncbi:hypothetical protein BJ508DRAFT_142487 [Ascobolus immersus RN42]|uniref:Uncharacterized protein n=1 Tax=Ascobolus immersus RN42 TaxID=1160509 RepID=A0A3N4I1P0_ASCIM|nr:hypothetical protein BJ508DRAFT_142487 [Ascobolus immersus RN42]